MTVRVWAPRPSSVALVRFGADGSEDRSPMEPGAGGWWTSPLELPAGTDYGFALDDGPSRPDPRGRWLPSGVHGPTRVFDASAHPWSDEAWPGRDLRGAVTYELHVGTFTPEGTLAAAAARLDHLVDLRVDVVELMPVAAFPGRRGWGYDGVNPSSVHEAYGGPAALQDFVDAAHGAGLAVCLDVVYNHLGPSGNYLAQFGPYFTDAHHTPWGEAVNLDGPDSAEVRRWVIDSALGWFTDFHVDALRLDAVDELHDEDTPHLLAELSDEVALLAARLGRPMSLVAESALDDPVVVLPVADGGWGMTAQWSDDLHHAVHTLLTGERFGYYVDFGTPQVLRTVLRGAFLHTGQVSTFRGRPWGRPVPDAVDGHRFVVAATTHDQVGNRPHGDRPTAVLDGGALAAAAALVLLSPFSPLLFMGEEWGATTPFLYLTDHDDPDLASAVLDGRRAEFPHHPALGDEAVPDPQDPATAARSRLDWDEPALPGHARLLAWYRTLIDLRRREPDLASGDRAATDLTWSDEPGAQGASAAWLVLHRGAVRVAVNLAGGPIEVPVPVTGPDVVVLAAWDALGALPPPGADGVVRLVLPGRTVVVLR